ncbi:hypothetical protein STCU_00992 [Strigomonas culicis]|uniref:Uncharacterized protein n=1 Tax=Strigomonas culicis TaxID=28005 RepID=S9UME1_9TRYP|nr:hypothetical protein STCU_04247 [Strigomonas culicis]EPY35682.1 hypothetical protein STCU_00992 [Strigomonas culicis]|eukprot:EPY30078.1 hypothetical protein STCU_04247 [Strigomonas culicis]
MSSWLSVEHFMYSPVARYCRWGLGLFGVGGVAGDYYLMHYYQAFDPAEGRSYVIDWSPIGRPRCQMLLLPNNYYTNYSPWTPKNGDVVIARQIESAPRFMQLLNGRFVERETCGVALMRPLEEVEQERARQAAAHAELVRKMNKMDTA